MNKINTLKIAIFFGVLASIYSIWGIKSYALAEPTYDMSTDAWNVLNGQGGVTDNMFEFGASPEISAYLFDKVYNDIYWKVYDSTGKYLDDYDPIDVIGKGLVDEWQHGALLDKWSTSPLVFNSLVYQTGVAVEDAVNRGITLFKNTASEAGNSIKSWFAGIKDDVTGKITETTGKAIFLYNEAFRDTFINTVSSAVENGDISNLSNQQIFYTDHLSVGGTNYYYDLYFPDNFYFYTGGIRMGQNIYNAVYLVAPHGVFSTSVNYNIYGNVVANSNGEKRTVNYIIPYSVFSFTLDDGSVYDYFYFQEGAFASYVLSNSDFSSLDQVKAFLKSQSGGSYAYNYSPNTSGGLPYSVLDILNNLLGKYITSDQTKEIVKVIHDFPTVPQEVVNPNTGTNETIPQITPSDEQLQELIDLVNDIISDNEGLAEELGDSEPSPEPEPDPDPAPVYPPQGTEVPEGFPIPIFTPLINSLQLPFQFSSIFEPIFHIFGGFFGLFNMWLFLPSLLVILILIWALK